MPTLYDAHGNRVDLAALKQEMATPSVIDMRPVVSGHPAQGMTPVRLAAILRQAEGGDPLPYYEMAEEMEEKDLHYRSVLSTRKNQVAGLEITVEAAADDAQSVKHADFIRDWLRRDVLPLELFDILDAVGKGLSHVEILWDTTGRQWVPSGLIWRDPRWFLPDREDGRTPRLRSASGPQALAPYKFILHEHKSKSGLPIRGGLARAAAWCYLFKNFDVKSWVQFAESYGQPLRLGKYGAGASSQDKAVLLEAVSNIAADCAAIIPQSMAIEFVEAKLSGNLSLFERLADFLDRQVSKAVLGQTGTTDVGQHVGTADAHEQVRRDIERADAVQLSAALNRDLVRPMIDLNYGPQPRYPKIKINRPDAEDVTGLVDNVAKLVPLGLRVGMSTVRDKLGLPDPGQDEEILAQRHAPSAPVEPPAETGESRSAHSQIPAVSDRLDAVDVAVAEELGGWRQLMQPLVDPIQALVEECLAQGLSLEEFQRRLAELPRAQDPAALADHLGRLLFNARAHGEAGAEIDDV